MPLASMQRTTPAAPSSPRRGLSRWTRSRTSSPFTTWIDAFAIPLPRPRLQEILAITYYDQNGDQQTLPAFQYAIDTFSEPARIAPVNGTSWPYPSLYVPGTIQITYTTGSYGDGTEVNTCPVSICQAMLLLIGHWYGQREAVSTASVQPVPFAVQALLDPYKVHSLLV